VAIVKGVFANRRVSARTIAVVIACALAFGMVPETGQAVEKELREARQELQATKARIRERMKKLNAVQRGLNRLATEISINEEQIYLADQKMRKLSFAMAVLEVRTASLQESLNGRNREAYIAGPGAPALYLLTATSAAEAADRLAMLTEMNRRDAVLAAKVQENAERLSRNRAEFLRLERARQLALQQLDVQRVQLHKKFVESRKLFAQLKGHKEEVLDVIAKYRPFAVCPIDGPHAIGDNFGIWVHRTEENGGDHVHQGVDIMSPGGTPIVAPFDGNAVAVPNKLGGKAVNVYGEFGYVYNAHLSAYGQLGPVEAGDVIGYVGATGNTGANHDHFEWHPNDGPAADPYDFLMKVC
jgi:murein DD-endopeptidase MepM/ murein hydrolase activator NlpD